MYNFHPIEICRRFALSATNRERGFTLIELMLVVAIIAIILTLALPIYSNYSIRAKISEALGLAAPAKTAAADTCQSEPDLMSLTSARVGYGFSESTYVETIEVSGDCTAPVISVTTRNTGASPDPVLILTGAYATDDAKFSWTCATAGGQNTLVPKTCRS